MLGNCLCRIVWHLEFSQLSMTLKVFTLYRCFERREVQIDAIVFIISWSTVMKKILTILISANPDVSLRKRKRRTLFPAVRVQQHLSGPRDLGINLFIQLQDGSTSHPFLRKLSEQLWGFSLILECLGSVFCLHVCFVTIITHCKCDNML